MRLILESPIFTWVSMMAMKEILQDATQEIRSIAVSGGKLSQNSECKMAHNLRVLIDLAKYRNEKKQLEPNFDYVFDYLEENEFIFRDLGLKKKESKFGKIYVKKRLTKLLKGFAKRQPEKARAKLDFFSCLTISCANFSRIFSTVTIQDDQL